MIQQNVKAEIAAHAAADYPREACGLLVRVGQVIRYVACKNLADDDDFFVLDPKDYLACEKLGEIVAVVHSHPNGPAAPSDADKAACEATRLPWYILSLPTKEWAYLTPSGYQAPLYGRMWVHGVLDCYTFIRDWYRLEQGIELPDFDRNYLWWEKGEDIYVQNFAKAGFSVVEGSPRHGDVILMSVLSKITNHGAILLEGDLLAHHLYNRLSNRSETWGGFYRNSTTHILRHDKMH